MIRYIARYLIQSAYDQSNDDGSDPLPNWLRNWVNRDARLQAYESGIKSLEVSLRKDVAAFLEQSHTSIERVRHANRVFARGNEASNSNRMRLVVGLAATVFVAILIGTKSLYDSKMAAPNLQSANQKDSDNKNQFGENNLDSLKHKTIVEDAGRLGVMLTKSIEISRGVAQQLSRSHLQQGEIQGSLVGSAGLDSEVLPNVYRGGLHFIAKQLPSATVRMLGMSLQNQR